jgi:hypothetical protein
VGFLVGKKQRPEPEPPPEAAPEEPGPSVEEEAEALADWRVRYGRLTAAELRAQWPEIVTEVAWLYAGGAFADLIWGEPLVDSGLDVEAVVAIAAALGRILDRPLAISPAEAEGLDLEQLLTRLRSAA